MDELEIYWRGEDNFVGGRGLGGGGFLMFSLGKFMCSYFIM